MDLVIILGPISLGIMRMKLMDVANDGNGKPVFPALMERSFH